MLRSSQNALSSFTTEKMEEIFWVWNGNGTETLCISGSQMLLHYSQWAKVPIRYISTSWASTDWLDFAFCGLELLLRMQILESVKFISQEFLWVHFDINTRIRSWKGSKQKKALLKTNEESGYFVGITYYLMWRRVDPKVFLQLKIGFTNWFHIFSHFGQCFLWRCVTYTIF